MFSKDHPFLRFFSFAFFIFFVANILFLDYLILKNKAAVQLFQIASETDQEVDQKDTAVCSGENCLDKIYQTIYEATSSLKLANPTTVPAPERQIDTTSSVKEYYVSFGSGSSTSDEWTDVGGLQAYVDSGQYGKIKRVIFEASVLIPTGNQRAYVRLFNVTDKHPVWFSEVSHEGGSPSLLLSQPITLDEGNKLYAVQMKTSLKYRADLAQARLHITVE